MKSKLYRNVTHMKKLSGVELRETKSSDSEGERGRGKRKAKRKYPFCETSPPRLNSCDPNAGKESAGGTSSTASQKESSGKDYNVNKQNVSKELCDKIIGEFMNPNGPLNALIPDDQTAKACSSKTSDSVSPSSGTSTPVMKSDAVRSQTVVPEPIKYGASISSNTHSTDDGNESSDDSVHQSDDAVSLEVHTPSNSSYIETETNTTLKDNSHIIIDLLTEIQATTNLILQKLNSEQPVMEVIIPSEDKLPALPCRQLDDLLELERLLDADPTVVSQLETKLLLVGGNNYKHCIYRYLRTLFTNNLAVICSLKGKKQNFALQGLNVTNILYRTLLKSYTVTKMQFDNAVMEWFKHGRQRSLKESQH